MNTKTTGLWPALLQVQGELGAIKKDTKGNGYRYLSFPALLDAVRPELFRAGLVLTYDTDIHAEAGLVIVLTHIVHADTGERTAAKVAVAPSSPINKDGNAVLSDPQQVGVAISYGKRYGTLCILALPTDDSDGVAPSRVAPPQVSSSNQSDDTQPTTPAAALAPRQAALKALEARIGGGRAELGRRLDIIADANPDEPSLDSGAPERERLGALMGGERKAWRSLSDGDFAALISALSSWPEGL